MNETCKLKLILLLLIFILKFIIIVIVNVKTYIKYAYLWKVAEISPLLADVLLVSNNDGVL